MNLPEGYESWIGERGVKLSVGQKQRLSIARVLLEDPPIVIFDEATSNVDTETEVKIREAVHDLTSGRTTFIIAHRLATLDYVDRIVVVQHGRIVEEGVHEDHHATWRTLRRSLRCAFPDMTMPCKTHSVAQRT